MKLRHMKSDVNPVAVDIMADVSQKQRAEKTPEELLAEAQDRLDEGWVKVKNTQPLVERNFFMVGMSIIVVLNMVSLGLETDYGRLASGAFSLINNVFLVIFIGELCLRLITFGFKVIVEPFTFIDILCVLSAFIERMSSATKYTRSFPVLRIIRAARLLRQFNILKRQKELRSLLQNLGTCVFTVIWMGGILTLTLLALSCAARKIIGDSGVWAGSTDPRVDHDPFSSFDNHQYFGSIYRCFVTLMEVATLSHWADSIARPIIEKYGIMVFFFVFFGIAIPYGLMMGVVSVVVQDTVQSARNVEAAQVEMMRDTRKAVAQTAGKLLTMADTDGSSTVELEELEIALQNPEFVELLHELEVPVLNAESLMQLFDRSGNGCLDLVELVDGICLMSDDLVPKDFVKLSMWSWALLEKTKQLENKMEEILQELQVLRSFLEDAYKAVERFVETRDASTLREKALHNLRTVPDTGPNMEEINALLALPEKMARERRAREVDLFQRFSRRYVGIHDLGPNHVRSTSCEKPPPLRPFDRLRTTALVCGRAKLGDPPPPWHVQKQQVLEEQGDIHASTWSSDAFGMKPSETVTALRGIL